jgi:surface protein
MFYYGKYNQPLGNWNVGKVQTMERMFSENRIFNQDLSSWNLSRAQDLDFMFGFASVFNNGDQTSSDAVSGAKPLTWNTPSLSSMTGMFYAADRFNQNVNSFDTSRVAILSDVFHSANAFNNGDPVGVYIGDTVSSSVDMTWNTSAATSFVNMFREAKNFNQNLNTWDVRRAKNFGYMFSGTDINNAFSGSSFNNGYAAGVGATLSWTLTTSPSIFMNSMFENNGSFNQNLNGLGFSAVTNLGGFMSNALLFNNGHAVGAPGVASWGVRGPVSVDLMFRGASAFNQDLNSWDMSQVTSLNSMFGRATRFNNGDLAGAFEGDSAGSDVRMLWNVGNVTSLDSAFTEALNFNQNISSWNVSKVTSMDYTFGTSNVINGVFNNGASSVSSNVMPWSTSALTKMYGTFSFQPLFNADISAWSTSKLTTLTSAFSNASRFNQDISNWDTSKVTHFGWTFLRASAFNQPIGKWTVSAATNYISMLNGPSSFSQDLSNWGPFSKANTNLGAMFGAGAPAMGDSPKNWDITGVTNFDSFFASSTVATTSAMSPQSIRSIIGGWSLQKVQTTRSIGYFRSPLYTNCVEWSAYWRLKYNNGWTFNGAGNYLPTPTPTCNSVTVTWSPTVNIPFSDGTVSPNVLAVTNGPSGVKYAMHHAGSSNCRVNPDTGVINYAASGSCQVVAYDADTNSNTTLASAFRVVTFNLPTPGAQSPPGAPTGVNALANPSALSVTFSAPASTGGLPLLGYEVGYSLTQGGALTWVSVSPVVTSSPTLSFTLSGLVNGTSYWLKVRAINQLGAGTASSEFGPVTPATTPSAPSIASSTISAGTVTLNLGAPATNGGSAITSYEYRFATNSSAVLSASWTNSASTSTTITVSGLVNGNSYFFQVRAVNSIGAGGASAVSSALTPITTSSPPIVFQSNKVGSLTSAEIQFFAPADTGGSAILEYQVRSSVDEGDVWSGWTTQTATYNVNNQRLYINLSGLQGTNLAPVYYTFEVRARNAAGFSGPSLQVPSGAPITIVNFGNQQAVINFKASKYNGNTPILGYEYQFRTGTWLNPTTISPWISISPSVWGAATTTTVASFTVSGLTNGLTYNFWVRAVNAVGGDDRPYWNWVDNAGTPSKQLPTITFSYSVGTVTFTESASFSPTFSSNSLGDITFSTTTPTKCSVATVSGVVTNLNAGLCTIQLSQAESTSYSAITVLRYINTAMANQPTLQISASATSSPYLGTVTLTSSGGAGSGAVTFTAAVGSTCVVSGNVVTVGNAGSTCNVIANKASDGNYSAANSTQLSIATSKISQSAVSFSSRAEMEVRSSLTVSAIGGTGTGVLRYRVSSAGSTGCSLSGTTLTATGSGQCTIEASRATSTNYLQSDSASQIIEIVKSSQNVRFTSNVPADPTVGSTYTPAATASSGLTISYLVTGASCTFSAGTVTFTSAGDCTVTAGQVGNVAFAAASSASQDISVGRRNHTLEFSTASQVITTKTFGDPAFLIRATSTDPSAVISYTVSPETTNDACSVLSSGLVFVLSVGDCVIQAYSPQTVALAAASTVSHRITVLADEASAPFITSVAMGNLSITAGFTPPSYIGGSTVSAYAIVAVDQSSTNSVDVSDSSCGTALVGGQISCRITGLENGRSYKIKVAAVSAAGIGEYSALSPAITVATNPAAVQNLRVIQGASTLVISWDDPDTLGGGSFMEYRIFVKRSASSSYVVAHPFRVTSATTRSVTISAETPPDGMSHLGGPALMNGVAYDIKIVTVTSVNQSELTGNTAVMNQIPRTVPDPPRLASALVIGNKLALTWTAPMSDGGAAVTSYSATVGNTPCVFNTVSETYCEIALPTTPGDYVFSIAAQNVAGSSAELQGVYTVIAPLSRPVTQLPGGIVSPPSGGGGGGGGGIIISEPAKPSESAPVIASVEFSPTNKRLINIRGAHFRGVDKVVIGGLTARVISQTTEMIVVESPDLKSGAHSVLIHLVDGDVLRHSKNLLVIGKPVVIQPKRVQVIGFRPGSSVLTAEMRSGILKALKANRGTKSLQCVGHTQGPTILKSDARLAMKRSKAVCAFAQKQGIKTVFSSYQNNTKVGSSFRRVDLFFTK